MKLILVLLALMAVIAVADIQFEDGRNFNTGADSDNFEMDAAMFDRWPRNIKRFTNKWQQLGPIWG